MDENKCKVYLLSGFLGSGKTTLLKHLLETHPEHERIAVLMNEFGKAGVDGDVVRKNGLEIIEISRGSIFCACAKGDFLRGLYTILKDYRPTVLLVEASGVADTTDMKKDLGHGMTSFRNAIKPISGAEKHHIAPRNGLFRNAKWALLESETSDFGLCYRVYQKAIHTEMAFITSDLTVLYISFAKIFCQNKIKKIHCHVI